MNLCFTLTMPSRGSWNGRWSGEENLYAKILKLSNSKAGKAAAEKILAGAPYYHRWSDGWGASIDVKIVEGKESAAIERKSQGFCGYEWMIDNIRFYGNPYGKKVDKVAV